MSKISGGFAFQRPLGRGAYPAGGPARAAGFPAGVCLPPLAEWGFGKLVIGNVLRGRRPCPGRGLPSRGPYAGGGQKPRGRPG